MSLGSPRDISVIIFGNISHEFFLGEEIGEKRFSSSPSSSVASYLIIIQ